MMKRFSLEALNGLTLSGGLNASLVAIFARSVRKITERGEAMPKEKVTIRIDLDGDLADYFLY